MSEQQTLYYVDGSGNYLGGFAGASPPAGAIAVAEPPADGRQTWNGSAWVDSAASLAAKIQVELAAVLVAGIAITSTGTPALNATYALDQTSQDELYKIASYAQAFGAFPNGQATMAYNDITGAPHTFTIPQIINLLKAIAPYVTACEVTEETLAAGGSAAWPLATAIIA